MFLFVIAVVLGLIGLIALIAAAAAGKNGDARGPAFAAAGIAFLIAIVLTLFSTVYSQDPGESVVQRSISGEVVGQTTAEGFHMKAPWVKTISYDVRNLTVEYVGTGEDNYSGGSVTGRQVTMQVSNGTTADVDLAVRYSIAPEAAQEIYERFGSQENFTKQVIENDIRSITRNAPVSRDALGFIQERETVAAEIQEALEAEWERYAITVEAVNLQEIRLPEGVQASFNAAQEAENREAQAIAEQAVATAQAESVRIAAKGQADANRELASSLTPEILEQKRIEAYNEGTVFVIPPDNQALIQVPSN